MPGVSPLPTAVNRYQPLPTLQGMFKDTELSNDVMAAFRASSHFSEQLPDGIDMTVSVLTSGFWPTYPVADAKLPQVRMRELL